MSAAAAAGAAALFYAALDWIVIGRFGSEAQARLGATSVAVGFAIGNVGGHAGSEAETLPVARGMGSLAGVVLVAVLAQRHGKRRASTRA